MSSRAPQRDNPTVLFMGPLTPPVNGQAVAFTDVYENYAGSKKVINSRTKGSKLTKIYYYLIGLLRTFVKGGFTSYDCVYFTCSRTYKGSLRDVLLILLARAKGAKVVNHLHGADLDRFYRSAYPLYQIVLSYAYAKIDTSIILLNGMDKEFASIAPSMRTITVTNSYGADFNGLEYRDKPTNEGLRLIYFSNLMYSKGITYLLEAFDELKGLFPDSCLDIVGKVIGDDHFSDHKMADLLKPYKNVEGIQFHDGLYGADKVDLLHKADIFVLPTFYKSEALPISMLEAMRAGTAIVVTKHNYLPDFFKNEMGEIVSAQDSGALVGAISKLAENRENLNKVKHYNYRFAKEHCGKARYIDRVHTIIRSDDKQNALTLT